MIEARRLPPSRAAGHDFHGRNKWHAVEYGRWTALCGIRPNPCDGWSTETGPYVNCQRCLKKLKEMREARGTQTREVEDGI